MTSEDPRKKNRRKNERRAEERRIITHPFGSPEWIQAIQEEYLLWPKCDRREKDRRCEPRRTAARRNSSINTPLSDEQTKKMYDLLTNEEKQMLNELAQPGDLD